MEGYILIGETGQTEMQTDHTRKYFPEMPFEPVSMLSEIRLAAGKSFSTHSSENSILIPVQGGLEMDRENVLVPGELACIIPPACTLQNASADHESRFLELVFRKPLPTRAMVAEIEVNTFNSGLPSLGSFRYRQEAAPAFNRICDCLIYVLTGNFEIENRFVKEEDALILHHTDALALECLSERGVFLFFRV